MSGYQSLDEILADLQARLGGPVGDVPDQPEPTTGPTLLAWERSIPKSYRWACHEAPELRARVRSLDPGSTVRNIVDADNVVILGPAGAGKTSLGVAALQLLGRRESRFVHAYRLGTARIQHSAGSGESALVDMAMTMPLVLLDDVGNERQTATNAVPDVIFERHAAGLATWYTTAFEPEDIARKYGDGVARRMFERALIVRLGAR